MFQLVSAGFSWLMWADAVHPCFKFLWAYVALVPHDRNLKLDSSLNE
jgi:hypothetical protein